MCKPTIFIGVCQEQILNASHLYIIFIVYIRLFTIPVSFHIVCTGVNITL